MKEFKYRRSYMLHKTKILALCALMSFITATCSAQHFSAPDTIDPYTIGVVSVEHPDPKFVKIEIREIKGNFLSVKKLKTVELKDSEQGNRRYGFTGPPGRYIIEAEIFNPDTGFATEEYIVIIKDKKTPEPDDPDIPDPPDVPDNPTVPEDNFDNLGQRIAKIAPNSMRAEYSSAWEGLVDKMTFREGNPPSILTVLEAARQAGKLMSEYDGRGWQKVNQLIKQDSATRRMDFQQAQDYYKAICVGIRGK